MTPEDMENSLHILPPSQQNLLQGDQSHPRDGELPATTSQPSPKPCPTCNDVGRVWPNKVYSEPCPTCGGTSIFQPKTLREAEQGNWEAYDRIGSWCIQDHSRSNEFGSGGNIIAIDLRESDAKKIVACLNALSTIPSSDLSSIPERLKSWDEMLVALRAVMDQQPTDASPAVVQRSVMQLVQRAYSRAKSFPSPTVPSPSTRDLEGEPLATFARDAAEAQQRQTLWMQQKITSLTSQLSAAREEAEQANKRITGLKTLIYSALAVDTSLAPENSSVHGTLENEAETNL